MDKSLKQEFYHFLRQCITENKQQHFDRVIQYRTRHITVALEDIFQSHNASAVLRSCDCFGVQDVYTIENTNKFEISPDVALGSSKWLNLIRYNQSEHNTLDCINDLKQKGYRLVATTPHQHDYLLDELPLDEKIALFFGAELNGLSDEIEQHADYFVKIPMYGFTESFNISVSAALCLFHLTEKLRYSNIAWQLSKEEKLDVLLMWAQKVVKRSELLRKKFLK
ncbi:MAG: RNA methyltransferase [Bacteroidales bacterium]|nr:RNA methyltransferase [Bacteroidales bacterium]